MVTGNIQRSIIFYVVIFSTIISQSSNGQTMGHETFLGGQDDFMRFWCFMWNSMRNFWKTNFGGKKKREKAN